MSNKRLYKSTVNCMLCGVCGGIVFAVCAAQCEAERDDVLGGAQLPCDALHGAGGDGCGG